MRVTGVNLGLNSRSKEHLSGRCCHPFQRRGRVLNDSEETVWLPYARQEVDADDIEAVVGVLRSEWLTTGPKVEEFEQEFALYTGARYAVAMSSGTAALHGAMFAVNIGPGDEVIVPSMTFAATANCIVFQGGIPVFSDVDPHSLLIDPRCVEAAITPHTKAVIAMDYAGQPCDYDALELICGKHGLALTADACHALGGSYKGRTVGSLAELNCFSLHPVKPVTAGEGGVVTTDNGDYVKRMRMFRNHGIDTDHRERRKRGSWFYEMQSLGYNYRITDFQCALGLSQLKKLSVRAQRRREIAALYDTAFADLPEIQPLGTSPDVLHAYHLYVVQLAEECPQGFRDSVFSGLRAKGIGVNVHYIPVHLHPYYVEQFGTGPGLCPVAEGAYNRILSLPLYSGMIEDDVSFVVESIREIMHGHSSSDGSTPDGRTISV